MVELAEKTITAPIASSIRVAVISRLYSTEVLAWTFLRRRDFGLRRARFGWLFPRPRLDL